MQWKKLVQSLNLPWSKWLSDTNLIPPVSGTSLLVVPETLSSLATSLEFLSQAYRIAKQLYPEMHSLLPVSGSEYELLIDDEIEIHDIKL